MKLKPAPDCPGSCLPPRQGTYVTKPNVGDKWTGECSHCGERLRLTIGFLVGAIVIRHDAKRGAA